MPKKVTYSVLPYLVTTGDKKKEVRCKFKLLDCDDSLLTVNKDELLALDLSLHWKQNPMLYQTMMASVHGGIAHPIILEYQYRYSADRELKHGDQVIGQLSYHIPVESIEHFYAIEQTIKRVISELEEVSNVRCETKNGSGT